MTFITSIYCWKTLMRLNKLYPNFYHFLPSILSIFFSHLHFLLLLIIFLFFSLFSSILFYPSPTQLLLYSKSQPIFLVLFCWFLWREAWRFITIGIAISKSIFVINVDTSRFEEKEKLFLDKNWERVKR